MQASEDDEDNREEAPPTVQRGLTPEDTNIFSKRLSKLQQKMNSQTDQFDQKQGEKTGYPLCLSFAAKLYFFNFLPHSSEVWGDQLSNDSCYYCSKYFCHLRRHTKESQQKDFDLVFSFAKHFLFIFVIFELFYPITTFCGIISMTFSFTLSHT